MHEAVPAAASSARRRRAGTHGLAERPGNRECFWPLVGAPSIGTRPFRTERAAPDRVVIVRNEAYWRRDEAGGRLPRLERVVWRWFKSGSSLLPVWADGEIDLVSNPSTRPSSSIHDRRCSSALPLVTQTGHRTVGSRSYAIRSPSYPEGYEWTMRGEGRRRNCYATICRRHMNWTGGYHPAGRVFDQIFPSVDTI